MHITQQPGTYVVPSNDRQAVRLLLVSMTTELTETVTAVQSLPSLLYAATLLLLLLLFF